MSRFAAKTKVSADKTQAEIRATAMRYGADSFVSGFENRRAMVKFRIAGRTVRLVMTLPDRQDEAFTRYQQGSVTFARVESAAIRLWEEACRQRWRAMLLLVKAKLEAVESGIVTFEEEFFAHVEMPDGSTVYENARAAVALAYDEGRAQVLLPGRGQGR